MRKKRGGRREAEGKVKMVIIGDTEELRKR